MVVLLMEELGFRQTKPIRVKCDNTAAITTVSRPDNHPMTKHIEIRYLYAREIQEAGRIQMEYCNTNEMIADALTKPLPRPKFEYFRGLMGVHDLS